MMENKEIDKIFNLIKSKKFDALFLSVSNENLYEFTKLEDNTIYSLTRFSGDTASLLVTEFEAYLYVDGRFTIQAKKEIKNKKIKIVTVNKQSKIIDDLYDKLCIGDRLMVDYNNISIDKVISIKEKLSDKIIKLSNWRNNSYNINTIKIEKIDIKNCSDNLFIIPQKYVTKKPALKIKKLCDLLKDKGFNYYITSSLEEIAYLTNLRKYPKTYNDIILTTSFMIVSQNESYLYLKEDINESIVKFLNKNSIKVKKYQDFYEDLYKYRNCMYAIDAKINNYYIYKCLMIKNKSHFIDSPLLDIMSKKENKEIKGIRFCNVIDGIAITKSIYDIKARIKLGEKLSEYDIKGIVDNYRKIIGKNDFISPSFETIVAYNENSAICHYVPKETQSAIVKKNG
ncbi:MAG: aminopeptidase P family N-terminal domain-containing protein, partial [Lachnospiraceae bacterium]|nr:aminopeptidase P family N-terminal domain-containing protein [Lachnospiraceae bacterium]